MTELYFAYLPMIIRYLRNDIVRIDEKNYSIDYSLTDNEIYLDIHCRRSTGGSLQCLFKSRLDEFDKFYKIIKTRYRSLLK